MPPIPSSTRRWLLVLLALALVVRLGVIAANPIPELKGDARDYDEHAAAIAASANYPGPSAAPSGGPTAIRPPAYPVALGVVHRITGTTDDRQRRVTAARVFGALLGVATVALIGMVALMLWGRAEALWAMGVAAVYPALVAVSGSLLSEALFTPVVVAAVACTLAHRRSEHVYRWAVGAGVLVGIAALTRTNGAIVLLPVLLGLWTGQRAARWRTAAAAVAACALVMLPWVVRNTIAFGEPLLSTQVGFTLVGTYNDVSRNDPENPAAWRDTPVGPAAQVLQRRDLDEAEMDDELRSVARDYVGEHPWYVAEVVGYNALRMLQIIGRDREHAGALETGVGPAYSDAGRYAFWAALLLAAAALVAVPKARRMPAYVWLVPALLLVSALPVNAAARYREPADPFLLLLAALALAAAAARIEARRRRTPAV